MTEKSLNNIIFILSDLSAFQYQAELLILNNRRNEMKKLEKLDVELLEDQNSV